MTADPTFPKKPAMAMEQLRKPSNTVHILGQEVLTILFLVVKPIEVTSGFILKLMKKLLGGAAIEILDI